MNPVVHFPESITDVQQDLNNVSTKNSGKVMRNDDIPS
jgi:hypothetical protein